MGMAFVNRFRETPFMATVYGTELLSMPNSRQARWLGLTDMFAKPCSIHAISHFTGSLLRHRFPSIPEDHIMVTPPGVDQFWLEPASLEPRAALRRFGIGDDRQVVLTVSRLDSRKGHLTVIQALGRLDRRLSSRVVYLVVGRRDNPAYELRLRELAARLSVCLVMAGQVDRVTLRDLYAAADVFCMPGEDDPRKVEGFGLVYLEAAAQGLVSVASRVGGVGEAIEHDRTGLLIEPGDTEKLAHNLEQLLTCEPRRRQLGMQARMRAEEFTWRKCAEATYGRAV
jgi:glycosyltransferase involved in cell wall biosynthesis